MSGKRYIEEFKVECSKLLHFRYSANSLMLCCNEIRTSTDLRIIFIPMQPRACK